MKIQHHELAIGTMLSDENIDVMMLEKSDPTVDGSSKAYWLIGEERVLVWDRRKGFFGHIKILSIKDATEEVVWDIRAGFIVGRVSDSWNKLMVDNNYNPLERD